MGGVDAKRVNGGLQHLRGPNRSNSPAENRPLLSSSSTSSATTASLSQHDTTITSSGGSSSNKSCLHSIPQAAMSEMRV